MTPRTPYASTPPADSAIQASLPGAYFYDAWSVQTAHPERSALGQFVLAFAQTPRWIDWSMRLRNRVVRVFGLKDLGRFGQIDPHRPEASYQPGDRLGIFTLIQQRPHELIVGDDDRHLRVVLSIHQDAARQTVTVTTVVHVKNRLGRAYMLLVKPMHKLIAPATLRRLGR